MLILERFIVKALPILVPAYVAGTDKKTVKMASDMIAQIQAKIDEGFFDEAERMIDSVQEVRNIPFRIEFNAQCEEMAL